MSGFLIKSLVLKNTTLALLLKKLLLMSLLISPFTWIFEHVSKWSLGNADYVTFVIGAIVVDHLLGSIYHAFWLRDFTVKENVKGLLVKLLIIVCVGYLFEGLDALMAEKSILKDYTIMLLRLMVFLYPANSAFQNSYEMTGRVFPPLGFMKKLRQFSENATFETPKKADS